MVSFNSGYSRCESHVDPSTFLGLPSYKNPFVIGRGIHSCNNPASTLSFIDFCGQYPPMSQCNLPVFISPSIFPYGDLNQLFLHCSALSFPIAHPTFVLIVYKHSKWERPLHNQQVYGNVRGRCLKHMMRKYPIRSGELIPSR